MEFNTIKTHFKIREDRGGKCKAMCPSHLDREASLHIKHDNAKGTTILKCFAGCEVKDIVEAAGLKISDLFDKELKDKSNSNNKSEIVYQYKDALGNVLFEKVRFEATKQKKKHFAQKRIINGSIVWGLDGGTYYETFSGGNNWSKKKRDNAAMKDFPSCEPVVYNLPEIIEAIKQGKEVYVVEGEKDADNLKKWGLVATCNFDGASTSTQKPKWRKEYNKYFKGAKVIVFNDNDDPGRAHADYIAAELFEVAESVKRVEIPGLQEKEDISDWVTAGHTKAELIELIKKTDIWTVDSLKEDLDIIQINFNPKYVIESASKTTIMPVMENIVSILKHYDYNIKYNEIIRKIFVYRNKILINELGNDTIYEIRDKCIIHKLNIPPQQLKPQLYRIGLQNTFNPVREYLHSCKNKWNGQSCLKELYETLKCDESSGKFKERYIRKMLVGAVNLILSENVENSEGVLTLAGGQGIGKTSWFRNLIPKKFTSDPRQLYFLEGKELELKKKDSLMEGTSTWIMELGEVASTFKKNEMDDLKNFITRPNDRFRVPYGTGSKDYRRYTFFVATVNDEEFLSDNTGSRRWWVLNCISINYNHNVDMDSIWGEAVYLWETGKETNYFTLEEQGNIQEYNSRFETDDETTVLITSKFDFNNQIRYWMKASDVFEILDSPKGFNTKKLGIALKKLKLETMAGRSRSKSYSMPPPKSGSINLRSFKRANYIDLKEVIEVSTLESKIF